MSWLFILLGLAFGVLGFAFLVFTRTPRFGGEWSQVAIAFLGGVVPSVASIIAIRNRKPAGLLFLVAAPCLGFSYAWLERYSEYGSIYFTRLLALFLSASLVFVIPGLFWLLTSKAKWPACGTAPISLTWRFAQSALLLLVLMFAGAFLYVSQQMYTAACWGYSAPLSKQSDPRKAAFIAKLIYLGPNADRYPIGMSYWSLARVEKAYWGVPKWMPRIVLVRGYFMEQDLGDRYLVDAVRSRGLISQFLPVFEVFPCCRTMALERANADLRVLENSSGKNGGRIIGTVYSDMYVWSPPVRDAIVRVSGAEGEVQLKTDSDGIYDLKGLLPGHYSVQLMDKKGFEPYPDHTYAVDMRGAEVLERDFYYHHHLRPQPGQKH